MIKEQLKSNIIAHLNKIEDKATLKQTQSCIRGESISTTPEKSILNYFYSLFKTPDISITYTFQKWMGPPI